MGGAKSDNAIVSDIFFLYDWPKLPHHRKDYFSAIQYTTSFCVKVLLSYAGVAVIDRPKCLSQLGAKSKMANLYDVEADADRSEERSQFDRTPKS